jgi:hypothetical protein
MARDARHQRIVDGMAGHTDDKLNARCEELIRKSAFEWYSNHSLGSHVTMLHELINF